MLDSQRDGATWIKRLSSYEAEHSTSLAARESWVRLLEDLGLQPDFVAEGDLVARLAAGGPRLLVLPASIALSNAVVDSIELYVEAGGIVVADHTPALYDERLRLRSHGPLDDLFDVRGRKTTVESLLVDQGRPEARARLATGASAAESDLTSILREDVSGFHVQMESSHGAGRAFYLNTVVAEYARVRLDPERVAAALDLRRRVRLVLNLAGVEPPVVVRADGFPTCIERMFLRAEDGRELLAVRVNALSAPDVLEQLARRAPLELELEFPREVVLSDVSTGAVHAPSRRHTLTLDPYVGLFLEVRGGQ
jgi:hypothetical protein